MPSSIDILASDGLLSHVITGFTPREPQQKMADTIERVIDHHAELIVEAGTGTGKTFGYLVPVFLAQKKTIISTGTKNLQDQLFFKDIPIIKSIFPTPRKIVLLKGRANYLCKYRLGISLDEGQFTSRQQVTQLQIIKEWSLSTIHGDTAELTSVPEDSPIWPHVTSTADNCLYQDCAFYNDCHVVKARQDALAADIVVVNHYLFFADLVLQEDGFGELLPGAEVVIFDEAHQIPEIASQFFSKTLTGRQLNELARDSANEAHKEAKDMQVIFDATLDLQRATQDLRVALGTELRRAPWPASPSRQLQNGLDFVKDALQTLEALLKEVSMRGKGLESCARRATQLIEHFNLLTGTTPDNTVHWFETHLQSFTIQLTPIVIAEQFKKQLQDRKRAFIFTSATLTVNNNFRLFIDALGLENALQLQLKSPFDYQKQALLYVPRGLPDTRDKRYIHAMMEAVIPVLMQTQGKAFVLFTSYRALDEAATLLAERIPYPILLQGSMPKRQLIDEFKRLGNAVLLGTSSFWYGVDVRGDALSCVIIDKLPFSAPDDPILQARLQLLRKQGVDPFQMYQLPHAVLILKQGAGRLIRDDNDRGILMICDPRLVGARYGGVFLNSLPDMPRTRDFDKLKEFLLDNENTGH